MERVVDSFGFKFETRRGSVGVKIGLIAEQDADLYLHSRQPRRGPGACLMSAPASPVSRPEQGQMTGEQRFLAACHAVLPSKIGSPDTCPRMVHPICIRNNQQWMRRVPEPAVVTV